MNRRFLFYFTCFALPLNSQSVISYALLNQWFQASLNVKDLPQAAQDIPSKYKFTTQFTHAQRVQVLSQILSKRDDQKVVSQSQLQRLVNLFTDISLFTNDGKKTDHNIMSCINRTTSAAGTLALHKMASTLLAADDPVLFAKRQAFIQRLTCDKELFDKVSNVCSMWAAHEDNFIDNYGSSEVTKYHKEGFDDCYYDWKIPFLNIKIPMLNKLNNEVTLNVVNQRLYNVIIRPIMLNVAFNCASQALCQNNVSLRDAFWGSILQLNPFRDISYIYKTMTGGVGQQKISFGSIISMEAEPNCFLAIAKAVEIGFDLFVWYLHYEGMQAHCNGIQFAHERNIGLSAAAECALSLQKLSQEYPMLRDAFVSSKELDSLPTKAAHNKGFAKLISLLQRNGTQDISMLWNSGHVLVAHKLIDEHKEVFEGVAEIVGEVDACLSLAKLYKEYEAQRVKYCFAQITDQEKPQFSLKGMWHPLLDQETAVTNDFAMGGDQKQHGIITGSNTAGKSTVGLKSPLISLYLAHSLGIAPATVCNTSRFNAFGSYLHVVDDTASGESAFQAEINRVKDICDMIEKVPKDKHVFVVLDELFRGTAAQASEHGTYKVAKYFGEKSNIISLLATHVKKVTELAHIAKHHVNFVIDAKIAQDGSIERDFKIKEGISDTNIAMKLFEKDLGQIFKEETKGLFSSSNDDKKPD